MGVRFTDEPPISPLTPTPSFGLMGAIDRRPSFTPSIDDRDALPSSSVTPKPAALPRKPHPATERRQSPESRPSEPNTNLFENRNDNGTNPFTKHGKQKNKNPFGNYRDNVSNNYSNLNAGKDVSDDEDEVSRNLKAQVSHHIFPTRKADPVNDGGFPEAVNPDIYDRTGEGLIPVEPNMLPAPVVHEPTHSPAPTYRTTQSDAYRQDPRGEMSRGPDMHRQDSFRPDFKQDMHRADSFRPDDMHRADTFRTNDMHRGDGYSKQDMLGAPDFRQEMLRSESFRQQQQPDGMLRSDSFRPEPSRAASFRSEVSRADTFKPAEYRSDTLRVDSFRPDNQRSHSFSGESAMPDSSMSAASRMGSVDGTVTPLHLLRDQSDTVDCPFCRRRVQTRIEKKASTMTHVTATTLFLTTIAGGVAPYAAKWQSNIHHYCTNCNRKVALKRHGRKMAEPMGTPEHLREHSKFETSGSRW